MRIDRQPHAICIRRRGTGAADAGEAPLRGQLNGFPLELMLLPHSIITSIEARDPASE